MLEEEIVEFVNNNNVCSIQSIKEGLKLFSLSNKNLKIILDNLCNEGKIFLDNNSKIYHSIGKEYKLVEVLSSSKGHKYFIDENNKKYNIKDNNLNGALPFSNVIVKRIEDEFKVVKVISHKNDKIVCEVCNNNDDKYLKPLNLPNGYLIHVNKKELKKLADGDRILVKVNNEFDNNYLNGSFVKLICHRNAPDKELLSIAYSKDFDPEFSKESEKELESIPDEVLEEELIGRLDLTDDIIFTIDGENTKDIDDAISLKMLENGRYLLGVHIADVAHYVKPGMSLFEDAKNRATSLYMIESVIPMLPQKLSNGICSLNPNVNRLARSCIMEIDKKGSVVDSKIVSSVIKSKKKMDYTSVNHIIEEGIIPEGYEEFYDTLVNMKKLTEILTNARNGQGKIDFANTEIEVKVDENGKPLEFDFAHQGMAEHLIENFMVIANETVASYFSQLPFVYRVHGTPSEIKLDQTVKFITDMGYRINTCGNIGSPKLIQNILNSLSDKEEYSLLSNLLLSSMKKAEYSINNIGHFGLALDNYTHFTSPIRRFPDLQVHTLIDMYKDAFSSISIKELEKYLIKICEHASYKERQADAAEEESKKLMMAKYMSEHIGEFFEGIIINNENDGMRVRTNDLIYGKICTHDDKYSEVQKLKMGTKVLLKVDNISMIDRTIYFSYVSKIYDNDNSKQKTFTISKKKTFNE